MINLQMQLHVVVNCMRCGEFGVKLSINIQRKLIHDVATLTVLIKMFYTTIVFKPMTE